MVLKVAFDANGKLIASHGDYSCTTAPIRSWWH